MNSQFPYANPNQMMGVNPNPGMNPMGFNFESMGMNPMNMPMPPNFDQQNFNSKK